MSTTSDIITDENYQTHYLSFRDRQAGVSLVSSQAGDNFTYNAYCLEKKVLKELLSVEFDFLDEAIEFINQEFPTWELVPYEEKSGCSTCVAK